MRVLHPSHYLYGLEVCHRREDDGCVSKDPMEQERLGVITWCAMRVMRAVTIVAQAVGPNVSHHRYEKYLGSVTIAEPYCCLLLARAHQCEVMR
jgi:hypothetical protein